MRVGLAGIGRMGSAIGGRLLDQGIPLRVWNRTPGAVGPLVSRGATAADSAADLADKCDVVLTLVSGEGANIALYEDSSGLLDSGGAVLVNLSTLSPQVMKRLATAARLKGREFVEAPVLGTVVPAQKGELVALAGGDTDSVRRVEPLLARFSRKVVPMGPVGSGTAMKLVHNCLLSLYWRSVGEAFEYGAANGLGLADMVGVIGDSLAANRQWDLKVPVLLGLDVPPGFDLQGLSAELAVQERLFEEAGVNHDLLSLANATVTAALAAGWGKRDVASIALFGCGPRISLDPKVKPSD